MRDKLVEAVREYYVKRYGEPSCYYECDRWPHDAPKDTECSCGAVKCTQALAAREAKPDPLVEAVMGANRAYQAVKDGKERMDFFLAKFDRVVALTDREAHGEKGMFRLPAKFENAMDENFLELTEAKPPAHSEKVREMKLDEIKWHLTQLTDLDGWEMCAKLFEWDTGFLRPGKSYPAESYHTEEDEKERKKAWLDWSAKPPADNEKVIPDRPDLEDYASRVTSLGDTEMSLVAKYALSLEAETVALRERCHVAEAKLEANGPRVEAWISVEDRLPEIGEAVDAWDGPGGYRVADAFLGGETWKGQRRINKITHWQPLPPPPNALRQQGKGDDPLRIAVEALAKEKKLSTVAINLLWRFDTDPSVVEFLKREGLWGAGVNADTQALTDREAQGEKCGYCGGSNGVPAQYGDVFTCPKCSPAHSEKCGTCGDCERLGCRGRNPENAEAHACPDYIGPKEKCKS